MAILEQGLIAIITILLIIIISAFPLYFAVNLLGGKATILKTFLVMLITAVLYAIITALLPYGGIIAFIILIWVYREMFRLKWIKAFLAWLLQIVFIILFGFLLSLFGLGSLTSYFIF